MHTFFNWLSHATLQTSLLICLVLLMQWSLRDRLCVRGRYLLWLVVVIRMALPWLPQSSLSVYNLLPRAPLQRHDSLMGLAEGGPAEGEKRFFAMGDGGSAGEPLHPGGSARGASGTTSINGLRSFARSLLTISAGELLVLFWLAGVCFLTVYIFLSHLRILRAVGRTCPVTDPEILDLLDDCRTRMGVRKTVAVISNDDLGGPALFGFVRPRLLLPSRMLNGTDPRALRHVFLHELAHLRRHDTLVGAVASGLHILHWFNPLVWYAFQRMRADRELACDGLVLSRLHPDETSAYGHTIVNQIEQLLISRSNPLLTAFLGNKARIKQRVAMILRFRRETYRWSPVALVLIGLLVCVGLTDGLTGKGDAGTTPGSPEARWPAGDAGGLDKLSGETWDDYARRDFPATHQDKHLNIQRAYIRNLQTGKYLAVKEGELACHSDEPNPQALWEFRFDEASNTPDVPAYFYSVAERRYLASDEQGNLTVDALEPDAAARWGIRSGPNGVWITSHAFNAGFLRITEEGRVEAGFWARDSYSYWEIRRLWRVKTSDDPKSNPKWQREKIPGRD